MSRLRPKPFRFLMVKPTAARPRLTIPAAVKVPNVVPDFDNRAICENSASVHISGFLLGAKPSKNHASIKPFCGQCH